MQASLLYKQCFKVIPIFILMSITSGCANSEQKYGHLLDARPVPSTITGVTEECAWIDQELSVIDQNIATIKTTKGFYAWYGPTAVVKEQRRETMLNAKAKIVGCSEDVAS